MSEVKCTNLKAEAATPQMEEEEHVGKMEAGCAGAQGGAVAGGAGAQAAGGLPQVDPNARLAAKMEDLRAAQKAGFAFSLMGILFSPLTYFFGLTPLIPSVLGLASSILHLFPGTGCCNERVSLRARAQQIYNLSVSAAVFGAIGFVLSIVGTIYYSSGEYCLQEYRSEYQLGCALYGPIYEFSALTKASFAFYIISIAVTFSLIVIYAVVARNLSEFSLCGCDEACGDVNGQATRQFYPPAAPHNNYYAAQQPVAIYTPYGGAGVYSNGQQQTFVQQPVVQQVPPPAQQ